MNPEQKPNFGGEAAIWTEYITGEISTAGSGHVSAALRSDFGQP